jgi:penicillin-binding protein 2
VHTFPSPAPQSVGLNPTYLNAVRDGLWQATHSSDGTSQMVFGNFQIPIAGKTGTAQKDPSTDQRDQSWWCGYGPAETEVPRIVICAVIENGGHGSTAAAPAALRVFEKFFGVKGGYQTLVKTD